MKNICVIGATGKLGKELVKHPNTIVCPIRFENASEFQKWFKDHPGVDTVWYVARACRKIGTRRDHNTFQLEINALMTLLSSSKHMRIVYASSKTVYGISGYDCCPTPCDHSYEIMTVHEVAKHFHDNKIGTYNCPEWNTVRKVDIERHNNQRTIYACTKLANEALIRKHCNNHKILRIWDIK